MKFQIETNTATVFTHDEAEKGAEILAAIEVERIEIGETENGSDNAEIRVELPEVGYFYLSPKEARSFGRLLIALADKKGNELQFV